MGWKLSGLSKGENMTKVKHYVRLSLREEEKLARLDEKINGEPPFSHDMDFHIMRMLKMLTCEEMKEEELKKLGLLRIKKKIDEYFDEVYEYLYQNSDEELEFHIEPSDWDEMIVEIFGRSKRCSFIGCWERIDRRSRCWALFIRKAGKYKKSFSLSALSTLLKYLNVV